VSTAGISDEALERFGLRHDPFDANTHSSCFYVGPQHREALAFLDRALHSNDLLVALTGDEGVGKSATLDFALHQTLPNALVATLGPLTADPDDFLAAVLRGFGFDGVTARRDELRGLLTVYLGHQRQKGVTTVIIADNPDVISGGVIEEVGWLALLEPVRLGRLKLVLLGGDKLERQLAAPRMHALRQMIRWQHRLEPLGIEETRDYLDFHAEAAGCARPGDLFSPDAVARIQAISGGLPARINLVASHALAAAAAAAEMIVDGRYVRPLPAPKPGEHQPRPRRVASLDILLDHDPKARIRLSASRLLIGRHPWNDVQLDHDSVSRHHAMLVREGGHWTVVDLNSTNGIRVNERETRQQRLNHGDIVQIGRYRLVLNEGVGPARNLPSVGDVSETTILRD
jgi:type II secretory pathway predicted ATPase ExeA